MKIKELFKIKYGQKKYHNKENLDEGDTLLISSQAVDNGCYGFFDIEPVFNPPIITVPSTGSIGYAFVQLNKCCVADDALVLTPKKTVSCEYLFYVATEIRKMRWRFNYGRKITPSRLGRLEVISYQNFEINLSYEDMFNSLYPKKQLSDIPKIPQPEMKTFQVTDLFNIERGQFHAISKLQKGNEPTVSRVSSENGLVGFYKKPKNAKKYPPYVITISTVTGDAFLQLNDFIATDNVLVCSPLKEYNFTTLLYVQYALNKNKWRYSYGRQPYKRIFDKATVTLPIKPNNDIDEDYIRGIVAGQPYFEDLVTRLTNLNSNDSIFNNTKAPTLNPHLQVPKT